MNQIYNKTKAKRRYVKKPDCPNRMGICEFDKCRCDMEIKVTCECDKDIKVNFNHEQKVINRIKEKAKLQNDRDNGYLTFEYIEQMSVKGRYGEERIQRIEYRNMIYKAIIILLAIPVLYVLSINLFGI